jgi:Transglycosylase-like domain
MHSALPGRSRRLLTPLIRVVTAGATLALTVALTLAVTLTVTGGAAQARGRSSYIVVAQGDHGARVAVVQRYLHVRPAHGDFGPRTRLAVLRWQAAHHRHRTGMVGRMLWRAATGHGAVRGGVPSRGGDRVTGLNWHALARCESGGNPHAVNSAGYYGLYQFTPSTWRSVGGHGLPTRASAGEQTRRAQTLFRRSGPGPWPVCGHHLFD